MNTIRKKTASNTRLVKPAAAVKKQQHEQMFEDWLWKTSQIDDDESVLLLLFAIKYEYMCVNFVKLNQTASGGYSK